MRVLCECYVLGDRVQICRGPNIYIEAGATRWDAEQFGVSVLYESNRGDSSLVPRLKRDKNLTIRRFGPLLVSTLRQDRKSYVAQPSSEDGTTNALIASYNVHKGIGKDRRFDPHRTVMVIKEIKPDIIALQEVDRRFGERSGVLDLETLKHECGLVPVPLAVSQGGHGWHGNVVLYRQGVVKGAHQLDLPGLEPRGAVVVDLDLPAGPLRIIAAHLGLLRRSRARQVRALLSAAEPHDERPVMLMGDLNEWRLGGRSALQGLAPVFGPLHAAIPSFPARFPVWALDRVLAKPQSIVSRVSVHDTPLARIASDHLPLKAAVEIAAGKTDGLSLMDRMATADDKRA